MTYIHPTRGPLHLGRPAVSPVTRRSMAKAMKVRDFLGEVQAPEVWDGTSGIRDWGMMMNDALGDCTCAALGHLIQAWTAESGKEYTPPDSAILAAYEKACGYDPEDPNSDQGGMIKDVLDYFHTVGVDGYKISAHAEVNPTQLRIQQAMYIFGGLDLGIALPITAQNQVGEVWDIVDFARSPEAQPGTWGGHSVAAVFYSPKGVDCVTWGAIQRMTWQFFMYYVEEAHASISPNWNPPVDVSQLAADLQGVGT